MTVRALRRIASLAVFAAAASAQEIPPDQLEFFEKNVRPVLVKNCYGCHSADAKTRMGGLTLDTRDGVLSGGQRGEAVVPGDPDASLLIQAVRFDHKLKMPPSGKLSDRAVADLEAWVDMGAPDPRAGKTMAASTVDVEKGREYWAFQPPVDPATPEVSDVAWPRGVIDQHLLAKMEAKGLKPVADADRDALLRRATFDLHGLPPTPRDLEAFRNDPSPTPEAFRAVVDRLLASPRFGERWARHWFDVSRYADSVGRTRNAPYPLAWRYRNYVIDSFNEDKPYDRFIAEQLAGDLLPASTPEQRRDQQIATGFLAMGAHDLNEIDRKLFPMDVADEMINVTSRAFLALTVGCARCHDHKFDPIPQKDYYAMAGVFRSSDLRSGMRQRPLFNAVYFYRRNLVELEGVSEYEGQDAEALRARYEELWAELKEAEKDRDRDRVRAAAKALDKLPTPRNLAMGVVEAKKPVDVRINIGGDPHELGDVAPRGFVQVLSPAGERSPRIPKDVSGRLQMAAWLTSEDNPLTARVMANRVWHHLFGRGIVRTVDNFGKMGSAPTHPELLDYLATQFVAQGWSVKALIREVMLSRAYQLSTEFDQAGFDVDPDNDLLWRMNRRRLEVEAMRDSILRVSGELSFARPEASPVFDFAANQLVRPGNRQVKAWEKEESYRSVYVPVIRNVVNRWWETFDFPEPSETHGARAVTTVAPQALFFMNDDFVARHSSAAAERTIAEAESDAERVTIAYRRTLSRDPGEEELARALAYVAAVRDGYAPAPPASETEAKGKRGKRRAARQAKASPGGAEQEAWTRLYQALIESAEFRYRG